MAKIAEKIDAFPGQGSIFEAIRNMEKNNSNIPGGLALDHSIRELITAALKKTTLSRYGVAGEMSRLLGREVSKAQLDSWSAESKSEHRFPLGYLGAFCQATGDREILRFICHKVGGFYVEGPDALCLELGRITQERKTLSHKEKLVRSYLSRVSGRAK